MDKRILFGVEWCLEQKRYYPIIISVIRCGQNSIDSVIDLVTSIEKFKSEKRISATVFLDIKSVFNSTIHSAIFESLKEPELGGHIHRWLTFK